MKSRFSLVPLAALLLLLAAAPRLAQAQTSSVGIGTTTPAASAALDVSSTSKGLLPPRLTQVQRDAIASPAAGLVIFNTNTNKLNTWNGTSWDAALSAPEQVESGSVVFTYTGAVQTFIVPPGYTQLAVDVAGAGSARVWFDDGGRGARVTTTLTVVPGQILYLYVGGEGTSGSSGYGGGSSGGGYNGGGSGSATYPFGGGIGGGGGASDIRTSASGAAYTDRLVVAGGGGGAGSHGAGGAGGAPDGIPGGAAGTTAVAGVGATQASGYALGQGGSGQPYAGQGGGGGGYYGGGAGGGTSGNGGGGGGGSSWVTPTGATGTTYYPAAATAGRITISYARGFVAPALDGRNLVNVPGTWSVSGSSVFRPAGNVGIGTSSPTEKLEIRDGSLALTTSSGAAQALSVGLRNGSGSLNLGLAANAGEYADVAQPGDAVLRSNGKRLVLAGRDGGSVVVSTGASGDTERLRVTSGGSVGVGVGVPTQQLDVQGGILARSQSAISTQGAYLHWNRSGGDGETWLLNQKGGGNQYAGVRFGKSDELNNVTEWARFIDNGNLGLGTVIPTQKLEVAGQIYSSTGGFRFPDGTVQTSAFDNTAPTNAILNQAGLQAGASFNISGNGYVGGRVGIGTTNPGHPLTVQADASNRVLGINTAAGADKYNFSLTSTGLNLSESSVGGGRLFVKDGGNVGIGTTNPGQKLEVAGQIYSSTGGFRFPDGTVQTSAFDNTAPTNAILNQGSRVQSADFRISGSGEVSLLDAGLVRVASNATVGGQLTAATAFVTGQTQVQGRFDVIGATTLGGTSAMNGTVAMGGTFPTAGYELTVRGKIFTDGLFLAQSGSQQGWVLSRASNGESVWTQPTLSMNNGMLSIAGGNSVSVADNLGNHVATRNLNMEGYLLTGTQGVTRGLYVDPSGNVGIGTTNPGRALEIRGDRLDGDPAIIVGSLGGQAGAVYLGNTAHGLTRSANDVRLHTTSGNIFLTTNPGTYSQFALTGNGNVGIGTQTPAAPLHVKGSRTLRAESGVASFFYAGAGLSNITNLNTNLDKNIAAYFEGGEVWVDGYIVAGNLNTTSDRRIKRVVGLSDRATDLALLNKIRITDYTYIDQVNNTPGTVKKVIAQEVEEVLPTAVSRSRQALPDVYERATKVSFAGGFLTVTMGKPHGLPAGGGRMRFYTPANDALNPEVTVVDAHTVRFASAESHAAGLFVYGKYVDDFRSVDYDALSMLNVSATQELARKVAALEAANAALQARAATAETRATQATATLDSFEARLRRLEAAGEQARK